MTMEKTETQTSHLTDAELFGLAIPAAGEPEALPAHLSDCLACTRALSEWKAAVRMLADDAGPLDRRTAEDWARAEDRTLELVRRAGEPRPRLSMRWAVGIAATLLLVALAIPLRRSTESSGAPSAASADRSRTELSGQDQADDKLLREVTRLTSADDDTLGSWNGLAPEPGGPGPDGGTL